MRRDQLLEAAAEADDDVLTKYLEGEEISNQELEACLHKGVRESILAPAMLVSAEQNVGVEGLLDAIVRYLPSPAEEPPVRATGKGGAIVEVACDRSGPLLLQVFKTAADPFVGRLTYFRVQSGVLHSHDHVWNTSRDEEERIGQLLYLHGKEQEAAGEIGAGEIGAVAKLVHTETGNSVSSREVPVARAAGVPRAHPGRGRRAADQGRHGQARRRPGPPAGGGPGHPRRPPGGDRRAAPAGPG